jgi:hypothetical protein
VTTASIDKTTRIWDADSGKQIVLKDIPEPCRGVDPDNRLPHAS